MTKFQPPQSQFHLKNGHANWPYTSLLWGLNVEWLAHCRHSLYKYSKRIRKPQPRQPIRHQPHGSLTFYLFPFSQSLTQLTFKHFKASQLLNCLPVNSIHTQKPSQKQSTEVYLSPLKTSAGYCLTKHVSPQPRSKPVWTAHPFPALSLTLHGCVPSTLFLD